MLKHTSKSIAKKGKRKVQGVPQSQIAAIPRPQEEEETKPLSKLFNLSLEHRIYQNLWKTASVMPLFKKGENQTLVIIDQFN